MSEERAYTASEINEIIAQLRDSIGPNAWVHLSFMSSPLENEMVVRVRLDTKTIDNHGKTVDASTIEEALIKAHEAAASIMRPDDAYAIIGIQPRGQEAA